MPPPANAVYVVQGEMSMVVSCMRRNARWASDQDDQDPLLQSFSSLKHTLASVQDLRQVDVDVFLGPFLAVVRSEATTGPITGVALSSINKFLSYGLIDTHAPQAASGIENIADAVTHAKFVGTDLASDEVVLMKILQVLRTILLTPVGSRMSNESVCELMQSCFRICFEMRLSELLRKSAEQTLTDMIHLLFSRLDSLSPPERDTLNTFSPVKGALSHETMSDLGVIGVSDGGDEKVESTSATTADIQAAATATATNDATTRTASASDYTASREVSSVTDAKVVTNVRGVKFTPKESSDDGELVAYGVPCIRELFRFLISLINPRDRHNNETMMAMGLALLTVALETGGCELQRFPALMEHVEDGMCKNLFALLKTESLTLYAATLRVIFLTFECQRERLKLQLQTFLLGLCEMEYPTQEHKEGALDTLLQLCRIPSFMMDMYLNYDCSLYCANLFETVTKFLSQNAYPEDRVTTTHLNALDCLLTIVAEVANRNPALESKMDTLPIIRKVKQQKSLMGEGVKLFNTKPKKGIKFFQENGILSDPLVPEEVSRFLRSEPTLDKIQIGELIAGRDFPEIRPAFVKTFDFTELPVDEALRAFLCTFRLPGESILIERIMEAFAQEWFDTYTGDKVPVSPDATFILLYAIIQLNVDQHNPRIKNPMTIEQFTKNQRGLNGDKDFPFEFLDEIYKNIKEREIILPSEQTGEVKEDFEWQLMLSRVRDPKAAEERSLTCMNTPECDNEIFSVIWGPTITALCYILESTTEEALVVKVLDGLKMCTNVCSRYELSDVFDHLVVALCKRMVTLSGNIDDVPVDTADLFVAHFGENVKLQLIAKTSFALVREHGNILRHGWQDILDVIAQFFQAQLMPPARMKVFDFLVGEVSLLQSSTESEPQHESSFISSLFGGGWAAETSNTVQASSEVVEKAKGCVENCEISKLFSESVFLQDDSLLCLCKSLISLSQSVDDIGEDGHFEPMSIFFLELLTEVSLANKDRILLVWESVVGHLQSLILNGSQYSQLAEHALINIMRLSERLYNREDMGSTIIQTLAILRQQPVDLASKTRPQVMAGLSSFIKTNAEFMKVDAWDLVMTILLEASRDIEAADAALDALLFITNGQLTQGNVSMVQTAAVACVDIALESTVNIETLVSEGDELAKPVAVRLLDVLHSLHMAVPTLYSADDTEHRLWESHWEPILQSMARFCTVVPRSVRQHALTLLHSSLMLPDMDRLSPEEWHTCLENVLFPLMNALLEPPAKSAPTAALEEIRMRTCALLCKVFLQHVSALLPLPSFTPTWLSILAFMEKYQKAGSELAEAVPESLKNMLLVMSTAGILIPGKTGGGDATHLWNLTYTRIESFLPGMCQELFNTSIPQSPVKQSAPGEATPHIEPVEQGDAYSTVPESNGAVPAFTFSSLPPNGEASTPAATVPSTPAQPAGSPKLQLHSTPITINL